MITRNVTEAKAELSALLAQVELGHEVVIARRGKPVATLVPYATHPRPRVPGALKGKISISPDFDAPVPSLEALFYQGELEPLDEGVP